MRVSSQSSSSDRRPARVAVVLASVGTLALVLFSIILITDGFTLRVGSVRLSAHHRLTALVLGLAAWAGAAFVGRGHAWFPAPNWLWPRLDRHATAVAVVLAAAAAGVGVGYGTYAASGADAGGYVSQSELIARGGITLPAPLAAQIGWPQPDWAFSPLGYRPSSRPAVIAPMYPPGLPLVMAAFTLAVGEWGPFVVTPLLAFFAVLCVYLLGTRLHSRVAGLVAAVLLATSPIFLFYVSQPMSDVPAASWWAIALFAVTSGTFVTAVLAGLAAGLAILTRPNLLPFLVPLFACAIVRFPPAAERWTARAGRALGVAIGLAPAGVGLLLLADHLYGSPFESGYGSPSAYFAWAHIVPNLHDYSQRLVVGEAPALILTLVCAIALWRSAERSWPAVRTVVLIGAGFFVVAALSYLPYVVFTDWYYLRFFLPAFPACFVAIGVLAVVTLQRVPVTVRAPLLLAALVAIGVFNVARAARQDAFRVRESEARYQIAGRYLATALPPNAVIFAFQESASAWYYTHRPIVRWDLIDPSLDLDAAIEKTRALGRHPVLLIEDWETRILIDRFPRAAAARLDWRPTMAVQSGMPVRVFDLAARGRPARGPMDRLHAP